MFVELFLIFNFLYFDLEDPSCNLHTNLFNPHSRFEFDGFYFGKDVIQKISIYGIKERFKATQIKSLLQEEYKLQISESTIRRILAVCTVVKSEAIDKRTFEKIMKQGVILMGIDGEDPQIDGSALWFFLDLISNLEKISKKSIQI